MAIFKFFEKYRKKEKKGKLHREKEYTKSECLRRIKMIFFKAYFFFAKSLGDEYCFCHWWKQNYCIRHSYQAFNARQIKIFVEPDSIAKGCRFTYWSRFLFIECLQQLDDGTDSHFNRKRKSYKYMSSNQYFWKKSNYSKQWIFLKILHNFLKMV